MQWEGREWVKENRDGTLKKYGYSQLLIIQAV